MQDKSKLFTGLFVKDFLWFLAMVLLFTSVSIALHSMLVAEVAWLFKACWEVGTCCYAYC